MAKIIKKFNKLTKEERMALLRKRYAEKLKGRKKQGAYAWDTEEERESRRNNN